jgi:hypothetical protein
MRGLMDKQGEQFGYLQGNTLYNMDDEPTGYLEGNHITDLAGNKVWRVVGDGVYKLGGDEAVGYFSSEVPDSYQW